MLNFFGNETSQQSTTQLLTVFTKSYILPSRQLHWRHSGVFIVNFERISHIFLVFLLLTLSRLIQAGQILG